MQKITLSVIIPTRNEQRIVKKNLLTIDSYISKHKLVNKYELVISDYSTDNTPAIVKFMQKKNKKIKFIQRQLLQLLVQLLLLLLQELLLQ